MRTVWILLGVTVAIVATVAYRIVTRSGMLARIEPHFAGSCRTVPGVVGAEDVTIDPVTKIAYLSAQDRRALRGSQGPRGDIYALDLSDDRAVPRPLTSGQPQDFHPHGISLWRDPSGQSALFAINHRSDGTHSVEVFVLTDSRLQHQRSIRYTALSSPNDVVAVDNSRFYATNDRGVSQPGWLQTLEAYLALPWSSVSYFDGHEGRIVADGFAMANGIARNTDGTVLYVAECLGRSVRVLARDRSSGALQERKRIALAACPDNIEIDERGQLWVAAHPKLFALVAHARDARERSPSQVLRIDPENGHVDEVYLNNGDPLSVASTAAVSGRTMVLGAIFEPHVLVCTLP